MRARGYSARRRSVPSAAWPSPPTLSQREGGNPPLLAPFKGEQGNTSPQHFTLPAAFGGSRPSHIHKTRIPQARAHRQHGPALHALHKGQLRQTLHHRIVVQAHLRCRGRRVSGRLSQRCCARLKHGLSQLPGRFCAPEEMEAVFGNHAGAGHADKGASLRALS